eukprot:gnl/MRDRNA2_/MRDRNA2_84013_c0_seq3.p1 gnl/MRDRNA2_/MRDRNA2_84013_c0~~gnl/MRDRNA2_/MRDRNA2_84013_c0_seq3.p1  ORF type:complete len:295 (-),score=58.92 gnl/MRDRNA2_/MRDRNA2_84013_c0_seq3:792-1676(-)
MHAYAWQEIAEQVDEDCEVLGMQELEEEFRLALAKAPDPGVKKDMVHQWLLRVVLEGQKSGLINTPPPIVSRAFQELNTGMQAVTEMKRMANYAFPFPYAQMISYALILFSIMITVFVCGMDVQPQTAFIGVFFFTGTYFALNLIASQLEGPFGDDANDLSSTVAQNSMNESLLLLMQPVCVKCPGFAPKANNSAGEGPSPTDKALSPKRLSLVEKTTGSQKTPDKSFGVVSPGGSDGNPSLSLVPQPPPHEVLQRPPPREWDQQGGQAVKQEPRRSGILQGRSSNISTYNPCH